MLPCFGDVHMFIIYVFFWFCVDMFLVMYHVLLYMFYFGNSATSNNESIPFDRCGECNGF